MRITFDNMSQVNMESAKPEKVVKSQAVSKANASYQVAFDGKDRVGFGTELSGRNKIADALAMQDVDANMQNYRNQMTVMSHTMSDEDFAKMQEEGYDPSEMNPQEAVTILDRIKSELVKAGVHVEGYTDQIDMNTLAAALGSEVLAQTMVNEFAKQDIPVDVQNTEQVLRALDMAGHLGVPSEDTYYYMATNGMSATLNDFYIASASGSRMALESPNMYFGEEVKGYITKNITSTDGTDLDLGAETEKLLARLGMEGSAGERDAAAWLIEKGIPADKAAIARVKDIQAVSFPLEAEQVIVGAAVSIADGRAVENQNLADLTTNLEKAAAIYEAYQSDKGLLLVQNRLRLEEIRLHMTVETNLKLLESGFAIDTAPIEETIEALKQAKQSLAESYFPAEANAIVKYDLYQETRSVIRELPGLPVAAVGSWLERLDEGSLQEFHTAGKALEGAYQKAGERYETLGTAPRADMGDSIRKAFANIDEVLDQHSFELTDENRKALRILSYNHMDVSEESLERVKQAVETVERVVHKMTPAATLQMIRDGVNPLEETLPALEQYFEQLPEEYSQTVEKYSKFLYRLEHSGQLTPEEKEAFIGCYRLVRQMEKTDGAAIGALVNVGGEINFSNLLSAVRSGKFKGLDVKVDDAVGALSEEAVAKLSISEQIQTGYQKEQAENCRMLFREAARVAQEAYDLLERGDMEPSPQNLMAAQELDLHVRESLQKQSSLNRKEKAKDVWRKLDGKEMFRQEYGEYVDALTQQLEQRTLEQENVTLDIRDMRLVHKQLTIMQKQAQVEEYFFPMEIGGELTGIHLQITEEEETKGLVHITLESALLGKISGALQVQDNRVEGYFVGNKEEAVMKLRRSSDIVNKSLGEAWRSCEVEFIHSESNHIPMDWTRKSTEAQVDNDSLYRLSGSFLQAVKAVGDNA